MARDDVDDAGRNARLFNQLRKLKDRRRGVFGGLQHDGATRRQSRADLGCGEEKLAVPRDDGGDDADRLAVGEDEKVGFVDRQRLA